MLYTEKYQRLINNNGKYEYVWETKTSKWNHDSAGVYYYSETEPKESGRFWHYGESGEVILW